jgi:hypothetical protein
MTHDAARESQAIADPLHRIDVVLAPAAESDNGSV